MSKTKLPTVLKGLHPPSIANLSTGRYLIAEGQWYLVESSFTLEDARKLWKRETNVTPETQVRSTFPVLSSDGKKTYSVTNGPGGWSCNCTGFGFRRDCKHVQSVKKKV